MTTLTAPVPFAGQSDAVLTTDSELPCRREFYAAWLVDLVSHWGTWRHPRCAAPNALSGELGPLGRDARERAEYVGWKVEHGPLGYRVVGYDPPQRVYLVKPGPRHDDAPAPDLQLTMLEGVSVS